VEIEQIRIILLISMLGIAAIFDVKSRMIPDVIWIVFGGIGAVLYAWDYDSITSYHVIAIITSVFVGIVLWRWKITGLADAFAVIVMAVILPVHYEFVMMPIVILVTAFFLVVMFVTVYNVSLNLSDVLRSRKINIFSEFKSESRHKKAFAFFAVHRKRKYEKFVIPTESSMRIMPDVKSFVFLSSRDKVMSDSQLQSNGMYVQSVPPLIIYMFGVAVFLLLPEIMSMFF